MRSSSAPRLSIPNWRLARLGIVRWLMDTPNVKVDEIRVAVGDLLIEMVGLSDTVALLHDPSAEELVGKALIIVLTRRLRAGVMYSFADLQDLGFELPPGCSSTDTVPADVRFRIGIDETGMVAVSLEGV